MSSSQVGSVEEIVDGEKMVEQVVDEGQCPGQGANEEANAKQAPAKGARRCDQSPPLSLPAVVLPLTGTGPGGGENIILESLGVVPSSSSCVVLPGQVGSALALEGLFPPLVQSNEVDLPEIGALCFPGPENAVQTWAGNLPAVCDAAGMLSGQGSLVATGELEVGGPANLGSQVGYRTLPLDFADEEIGPLLRRAVPNRGGMILPTLDLQFLHAQSWFIPVPPRACYP